MTVQKRIWRAEAPSNIALIKYMGKVAGQGNRPTNASLSYTLDHLKTHVELELLGPTDHDRWEPLGGDGLTPIELSEKGRTRFLSHLALLKRAFECEANFVVRSANDFPADCGLASSASSFAALTRASAQAFSELTGRGESSSPSQLADLSRQGSGSSCRSFFGPWSVWDRDGARAAGIESRGWSHQVVVVEAGRKSVSSSEAHLRVTSSDLFAGRPERAEARMRALITAIDSRRWSEAAELCWAEFWDMHALFETASPSFGYMTPGSIEVLSFVRDVLWKEFPARSLVTMDAGANVHILHPPTADALRAAACVRDRFSSAYRVIGSEPQ